MGKQSARLYYQGNDHRDIVFQGQYHDKIYKGNQLVWEKIKDGKYFVTQCMGKIFIFYICTYNYSQCKDGYRGKTKAGAKGSLYATDVAVYTSDDGALWEKVGEIADTTKMMFCVAGRAGREFYAFSCKISQPLYIDELLVIDSEGSLETYDISTIPCNHPGTSIPYDTLDCENFFIECFESAYYPESSTTTIYATVYSIVDGKPKHSYGGEWVNYNGRFFFSFFVRNYMYLACMEKGKKYVKISKRFIDGTTTSTMNASIDVNENFEAADILFVEKKVLIYGYEKDAELNLVPVLLESTNYVDYKKTILPEAVTIKDVNNGGEEVLLSLVGYGDYDRKLAFGTIKDATYFEDGEVTQKEHIGIGLYDYGGTVIGGFAYIDNLYFRESDNNVCWIFK